MKEGYLIAKSAQPGSGEMEQINRLSRRNLQKDEVFVFSVVLCDNEIDRDYERFSINALAKLSELYIGKTGVFDHSARGKDQTARIFACQVEKIEGKRTKAGEDYHRLLARAYMPKTARNQDLIIEIDAGIKKEVSVGCAVAEYRCSVCGADMRNGGCTHVKGQFYEQGGNDCVCHAVLDRPTDAYEWSFVAVPAQPHAGVVKAFHTNKKGAYVLEIDGIIKSLETGVIPREQAEALKSHLSKLEKQAEAGREYLETLQREVVALGLKNHGLPQDVLKSLASRMSAQELKSVKKAFEVPAGKPAPAVPQLLFESARENADNTNGFQI